MACNEKKTDPSCNPQGLRLLFFCVHTHPCKKEQEDEDPHHGDADQ
jgi:hypothetical protein